MESIVPFTVGFSQPDSVGTFLYRIRMSPIQPSTYLWENICSMLRMKDPSVDKVAAELKTVARGTVQRAKEQDGHRKTDQLAKIAECLGLEVWQLLVPGLDPDNIPRLASDAQAQWPFTQELLAAAAAADGPTKKKAENAARAVLDLDALPRDANAQAA